MKHLYIGAASGFNVHQTVGEIISYQLMSRAFLVAQEHDVRDGDVAALALVVEERFHLRLDGVVDLCVLLVLHRALHHVNQETTA